MTRAELAFGRAGESAAVSYYVAQGWEVVDRNWRCSTGEIDLVVRRDRTLVICEVKARHGSTDELAVAAALEAVGPAKQRKLRHLAVIYLRQRQLRGVSVRFDVVAIVPGRRPGTMQAHVVEAAF